MTIKQRIKIFIDRYKMFIEFYHDYSSYKKWNYNNPKVHTKAAMESKILRQTHMLEKGMSLSNPRKGFGVAKVQELFGMLDGFIKYGYDEQNSIPFQNALNVLEDYKSFQIGLEFTDEKLFALIDQYHEKYSALQFESGIAQTTRDEIRSESHSEYPEFFRSRHSIRQFDDSSITTDEINRAVMLAQKAPTACNRQACKVYFYQDEKTNKELGELIAGNTGFENEVKNYLVLTADMSAFYDTFERNQLYIETGLFAMALVEALHYEGIASCVLQNGEYYKKNIKFKKICGNIPDNERITLFIAIGHYKDKFSYAVSKRKQLNDVLIVK